MTASNGGTLVITTGNNMGGTSAAGTALSFAGGNIAFTGTDTNNNPTGALTINGGGYTLIGSEAQLQAIGTDGDTLADHQRREHQRRPGGEQQHHRQQTTEDYVAAAVRLIDDHDERIALRKQLLTRNGVKTLFEARPEIFGERLLALVNKPAAAPNTR